MTRLDRLAPAVTDTRDIVAGLTEAGVKLHIGRWCTTPTNRPADCCWVLSEPIPSTFITGLHRTAPLHPRLVRQHEQLLKPVAGDLQDLQDLRPGQTTAALEHLLARHRQDVSPDGMG